MKKKKRIIIVVLVILVGLFLFSGFQKSLPDKAREIYVRNGNTGELVVLQQEECRMFLREFNHVKKRVSGVEVPSMGYLYRISMDSEEKKSIVIRGENEFSKGIFKYKTKENLAQIIEKYVK